MKTPAVSTLIPVLNDAPALKRCLTALLACGHSDDNQIIVADGGNSDECRTLCENFGAAWVACPAGRAKQMNRAAEFATGGWLWFLHADCEPARESIDALFDLDARAAWGCFAHQIDAPSPWLRIIESADNFRARMFSLPYGDQGIFVRADVFRDVGKFDEVPLLEDVLIARKLAEYGAPRVLKPILKTDARRWMRDGILRTTLTNWRIMFELCARNKPPIELAALYRRS